MLNFTTIREIWSSVEKTDSQTILQLGDTELVGTLQQQVENKSALTNEDINTLHDYIAVRLPLIRDLAYSRLAIA